MKMFKSWIAVIALILGCEYFIFEAGFLVELWSKDITKLSFVIIGLVFYRIYKLGSMARRYDDFQRITQLEIDEGFAAADLMMSIGMVGTIIGFIVMTGSFTKVDLTDVANISQLFDLATNGMSTALYTTLAGLIGSIFTKVIYGFAENKLIREGALEKK